MRRLGENAPKTEIVRFGEAGSRTQAAAVAERGRYFEFLHEHLERFAGSVDNVLIGEENSYATIDILHVMPNERTGCHVLVTSGMSDRPLLGVPADRSLVELSVCLPAEWPMSERALEDDRNYWPIGLLRMLAQLPHLFGCGLGAPDVVPNFDPPEPFAENTCLCGVIITPPIRFGEEFGRIDIDKDTPAVNIFNVLPLLDEEMEFSRDNGPAALLRQFEAARHNGLINPYRPGVVPARLLRTVSRPSTTRAVA